MSLLKNITLDPSGHLPTLINLLTSVLTNHGFQVLFLRVSPHCPELRLRPDVEEPSHGHPDFVRKRRKARSSRDHPCSVFVALFQPVSDLSKVNFIFNRS